MRLLVCFDLALFAPFAKKKKKNTKKVKNGRHSVFVNIIITVIILVMASSPTQNGVHGGVTAKKHALAAVQSETCRVWLHVHSRGIVHAHVWVYAEHHCREGKVPPSHLSSCAAILHKTGANGNQL